MGLSEKLKGIGNFLNTLLLMITALVLILGHSTTPYLYETLDKLSAKTGLPPAFLLLTGIITVSAILSLVKAKNLIKIALICWAIIIIALIINMW